MGHRSEWCPVAGDLTSKIWSLSLAESLFASTGCTTAGLHSKISCPNREKLSNLVQRG